MVMNNVLYLQNKKYLGQLYMGQRIKRLLFVAFALNCVQMNIFSQSAFSINIEKDIIVGLTSLGVSIIPFLLIMNRMMYLVYLIKMKLIFSIDL